MEWRMSTPTEAGQYQDTRIDVKLVLSALWIAMLIVFAYGDIFGLFRADVLRAALDRKMATTGTTVDQVFLVFTTVYILIPTLMVFLSLVLRPRVNRIVNIVVALVYAVSIVASCIGEGWAYYLLGSAVEVVLLVAIVRAAWTWPKETPTTSTTGRGATPHNVHHAAQS
jgi:glucan phosphoethanolaminetransferase (alkaline phosphatase superfamily)